MNNQKKLYLKIGFIIILILLLQIPALMIQDLVRERRSRQHEVQREISNSWGPNQKISGPILSIPYMAQYDDDKPPYRNLLRILPENSEIDVELRTEERKKSIYSMTLFNAQHNIHSVFEIPDETFFPENTTEILWEEAVVDMGFTKAGSLDDVVEIYWNNVPFKMESGSSNADFISSGIHARVGVDSSIEKYVLTTAFGINGSKSLNYLPIAKNTKVNLKSTWKDPGFIGLPLPKSREISEEGFSAEWVSTEYNRSYKSIFSNNTYTINHMRESFGVDLVQTVSHYQKNMRSAKYAILIISLSFLIFFFFEILKGNKIHAVQYMFIGLSLSIFYLLLLSFSEHIGFNYSYLIATVSVVGLICWYSSYLLQKKSTVLILALVLSVLYGYIFTLLQMEDFALLVGAIGLFSILGITMYLSRNLDWYNLQKPKTPPPAIN